jgi:hypothetical protein
MSDRVTVRLTEGQLAVLDGLAQGTGMDRCKVLRALLESRAARDMLREPESLTGPSSAEEHQRVRRAVRTILLRAANAGNIGAANSLLALERDMELDEELARLRELTT